MNTKSMAPLCAGAAPIGSKIVGFFVSVGLSWYDQLQARPPRARCNAVFSTILHLLVGYTDRSGVFFFLQPLPLSRGSRLSYCNGS